MPILHLHDYVCLYVYSLGSHAKQLFESYGSAMIKNLTFRDSMAFIGQKGINGFTSVEEARF